ncbi:hypothetical protein L5515_008998 [Caenorhabditis briggsae]|uniref:Uncharacterized protein n=1 Tax=Caenorhabditis briggsae TaxID=6238 RepID=A0AAE9F2G2_CAEBR|nr:hypothetical protein L5515_008998 [Caenorhabditis briggsae]
MLDALQNFRDFLNVNIFHYRRGSTCGAKAAGMTQESIDGLAALRQIFAIGYAMVQSNKEAADKFIADYKTDSENYIKNMPENDQTAYNNLLKKHGIA